MSQLKPYRQHPRRFGVDFQEEKAWISFYRRAGNPDIAAEVMQQLESDPDLKRTHLALYLCCKESLRKDKARQARNKRIAQGIRGLLHAVFVAPVSALVRLVHHGADIAVECLPEVAKEPAARRLHKLAIKSEFVQAQSAFGDAAVPAARQPEASSSSAGTA